MWFVPTKKELKKILKKITESFKQRDIQINEIKKELVSKKEIDLMIREAILKVQFGQHSEPKSEQQSKRKHFEGVMVKKAIKTRPELLKTAIRGLIDRDMRTTDIFKVIVEEKKLISKTQFYHYLSIVRSELRTGLRTELRTKLK